MKRLVVRDLESAFSSLSSGSTSGVTKTTWGGVVRTFSLPGGPYRFSGLSAAQAESIEARFGPWRVASEPGDRAPAPVETRVCVADASIFDEQSVEGVTSSLAREFDLSEMRMSGLELVARVEWLDAKEGSDSGQGVVRGCLSTAAGGTAADGSSDPRWLDAFENYLRTVVAYRVLALGGAMFHSSGVRTADGVHLFVGPSGAGKTTVARLSLELGFDVTSDDINVVLPAEGSENGFVVERVPFAGELENTRPSSRLGLPGPAPLVGIHRLVQGVAHELRALSQARRLAALVGSCPFVNADPYRLEGLLGNLEPLLPLTDELAFRKDSGFWQALVGAGAGTVPCSVMGTAG